jgi:hypothetical protein
MANICGPEFQHAKVTNTVALATIIHCTGCWVPMCKTHEEDTEADENKGERLSNKKARH